MISDFASKVYKKLKKVPKGRVTTYKDLAKAAGKEKAIRAVGNIMNKNPYAPQVPCHRVVKSDGSVGGFASGVEKKIEMLESEGVKFQSDKVINFKKIIFKFK